MTLSEIANSKHPYVWLMRNGVASLAMLEFKNLTEYYVSPLDGTEPVIVEDGGDLPFTDPASGARLYELQKPPILPTVCTGDVRAEVVAAFSIYGDVTVEATTDPCSNVWLVEIDRGSVAFEIACEWPNGRWHEPSYDGVGPRATLRELLQEIKQGIRDDLKRRVLSQTEYVSALEAELVKLRTQAKIWDRNP